MGRPADPRLSGRLPRASGSSSKKSNSRSSSVLSYRVRATFGPDHCNPCVWRRKDFAHAGQSVAQAARVGRPSPRPSSSSAATGRSGRSGSGGSGSVWLARDERTGRGRAQDRAARRQGGRACRARGRRGREAPPSPLPARLALASDAEHVYIAYEYVAGQTLREATPRRRRSTTRGASRPPRRSPTRSPTRTGGHRPPRRQAGERPARGRCRRRDPPARLRARPARRGGDAHRRRRRARDARLHLAGAPRDEPAGPAADVWAVGVMLWEASRAGIRSGRLAARRRRSRSRRGAPPLRTRAPTCRSCSSPRSTARSRSIRAAPDGGAARRHAARPRARVSASAASARSRARPPLLALARVVPRASPALVAGWTVRTLPFYPRPRRRARARSRRRSPLWRPASGSRSRSRCRSSRSGTSPSGSRCSSRSPPRPGSSLYRGASRAAASPSSLGPLLGPLGLLGLAPLLSSRPQPVRRALQTALAVLTAGLVAGLGDAPLPFAAAGSLASALDRQREPGAFTRVLDALTATRRSRSRRSSIAAAAGSCRSRGAAGIWGIASPAPRRSARRCSPCARPPGPRGAHRLGDSRARPLDDARTLAPRARPMPSGGRKLSTRRAAGARLPGERSN